MRPLYQAIGLAVICSAIHAAPPQSVQDLTLTHQDPAYMSLSWSPVTADVNNHPIIDVVYDIYRSTSPYFGPTDALLIGSTQNTSFLDESILDSAWYQVVVKGHSVPTLDLVTVPAGSFDMGRVNVASPIHPVNLAHAFQLTRKEVTNQQFVDAVQWAYQRGMVTVSDGVLSSYGVVLLDLNEPVCEIAYADGEFSVRSSPSAQAQAAFPNGYNAANHPVKMVTWYGAACYCDWISLMSQLQPYYEGQWNDVPATRDPNLTTGYRLPTEAEWEFAAQYDDERNYPWGNQSPNCNRAVFGTCAGWSLPVGSKPAGANTLGILDLAGNVYEWTNDWSAVYGANPTVNPIGPSSGSYRMVRGGGWDSVTNGLSSALRFNSPPAGSYWSMGFRVCRNAN
jgi:formylglycine-generating enzyme required for sulfatase activity